MSYRYDLLPSNRSTHYGFIRRKRNPSSQCFLQKTMQRLPFAQTQNHDRTQTPFICHPALISAHSPSRSSRDGPTHGPISI
jgi:hypothetical protein